MDPPGLFANRSPLVLIGFGSKKVCLRGGRPSIGCEPSANWRPPPAASRSETRHRNQPSPRVVASHRRWTSARFEFYSDRALAEFVPREIKIGGRMFREQTLSRDLASVMHSDRANRNGIRGKSGNAGYSRLARIFSSPAPTVSIRSQKGFVVLTEFILFLSCLWMFNRPN